MIEKNEKQQKFMVLRAEGKSFDIIANKIKVSKPTLLKWSKEFTNQIVELSKTIEEQFLIEQKIKRTMRAKKVSDELDEAYAALSKTDYKNMSKKDLIITIEKLEQKLDRMTGFGKEVSQGTKDEIIEKYLKAHIEPPKLGVWEH